MKLRWEIAGALAGVWLLSSGANAQTSDSAPLMCAKFEADVYAGDQI